MSQKLPLHDSRKISGIFEFYFPDHKKHYIAVSSDIMKAVKIHINDLNRATRHPAQMSLDWHFYAYRNFELNLLEETSDNLFLIKNNWVDKTIELRGLTNVYNSDFYKRKLSRFERIKLKQTSGIYTGV